MPAHLDIFLQRNEDWSRTLTITDDVDAPIDLTGMTVAMQVRDKLAQALVAQAAVEITDAENGEVELTLLGHEGTPLSEYGVSIQVANLPYDILLTDSDGYSTALIAGNVVLSRGETIA